MGKIEIVPADRWPLDDLAVLMTRGFEGYFVPVEVDAARMARMNRLASVVLAESRVAIVDGSPAALLLAAVRGSRRRVAAMGVAVEHRRTGVGRELLRHEIRRARETGCAELLLEVIAENGGARRLYESEGFAVVRRLRGWQRAAGTPERADAAEPCSCEELAVRVAADGGGSLPWQLAPETLEGYRFPAEALRLGDDAYALVAETDDERATLASLLVPADRRRQGHGRRMVEALAARFPRRSLFFPPLVPEGRGEAFLRAAGFEPLPMSQLEMRLTP